MNTRSGLVDIAIANKLSMSEIRLLLIILGLTNEDGICEVTLDWLCGALGLNRPNVSRTITGLATLGIIERLDTANRGRGAKPYIIRINPDPDTYSYNLEEDTPQPSTSEQDQKAAPEQVMAPPVQSTPQQPPLPTLHRSAHSSSILLGSCKQPSTNERKLMRQQRQP